MFFFCCDQRQPESGGVKPAGHTPTSGAASGHYTPRRLRPPPPSRGDWTACHPTVGAIAGAETGIVPPGGGWPRWQRGRGVSAFPAASAGPEPIVGARHAAPVENGDPIQTQVGSTPWPPFRTSGPAQGPSVPTNSVGSGAPSRGMRRSSRRGRPPCRPGKTQPPVSPFAKGDQPHCRPAGLPRARHAAPLRLAPGRLRQPQVMQHHRDRW